MLCEKCNQKQATLHLTEIKNGIKKERHLCEDCAKEEKSMKMDFSIPFSVQDIFSSIMDVDIDNVFSVKEEQICPNCNSTYNRFKNVGRFGCHECYNTFKDQLFPLVKRIQGSTQHVGKVPKKAASSLRIRKEIDVLKEQLNDAIASEDFENAAKIRDEIKKLEKDMGSNM